MSRGGETLARKTWPALILALIFVLTATFAGAEVPRETLERLADIQVEDARGWHLNNIGKMTDQDATAAQKPSTKKL